MAGELARLFLRVEGDTSRLGKDLRVAGDQTERFSGRAQGAFARAGRGVGDFLGRVVNVRTALAAVAGAAALGALVRRSIESADALADTADTVGLTTDELQELRFAAAQAGVEQATLDMAMQRFARRVAEVAAGTGELLGVAEQYNVQLRNTDGTMRSQVELLGEFADVIRNAESEQEALRIAFKLFDSEGAPLVNLLRDGAEGLGAMAARARELGVVIDEALIRDAAAAGDKMDALAFVVRAKLNVALLELAPTIDSISTKLADFAPQVAEDLARAARTLGLAPGTIEERLGDLEARIREFRDKGLFREVFAGFEGGEFIVAINTLEDLLRKREELRARLLVDDPGLAPPSSGRGPRAPVVAPAGEDAADKLAKTLEEQRKVAIRERTRIRDAWERATMDEIALIRLRRDRAIAALGELRLTEEEQARARVEIVETAEAEITAAVQREAERRKREREEETEETEKLDRAADELGFTFSSAFEDAIIEGKALREVLQGIGQDILRIALRTAVTEPFADAISALVKSGLGSLLGPGAGPSPAAMAAPGSGQMIPMARGGVIKGPTIFPARSGQVVLAGEIKDEAILPLKRTASGDLGVAATGASGAAITVNVYAPPGAQVETRERLGPRGPEVDVLLDQAMARHIETPGSRTGVALSRTFGGRRRLTGR